MSEHDKITRDDVEILDAIAREHFSQRSSPYKVLRKIARILAKSLPPDSPPAPPPTALRGRNR